MSRWLVGSSRIRKLASDSISFARETRPLSPPERAEISLNTLPAGANVPFVHSHKANEEIYGVLSGKGKVVIDGEEISLAAGDWLKISPMAKRQFFAASNSEITYICVQVKENSLEGYTATDAVIY